MNFYYLFKVKLFKEECNAEFIRYCVFTMDVSQFVFFIVVISDLNWDQVHFTSTFNAYRYPCSDLYIKWRAVKNLQFKGNITTKFFT